MRSPLMAASATFALKAGVWFRRGRLLMVSPDFGRHSVPAVRQKLHLSPCADFPDQLCVPLAIAVRIQKSWNIKLAALLGVMCAVVVTSFSLSQIGHLTFNPGWKPSMTSKMRFCKRKLISRATLNKRAPLKL